MSDKSCPDEIFHQESGLICKKTVEIAKLQKENEELKEDFKNFHKLVCESVNYTHDKKDWIRDQASLINHIQDLKTFIKEACEVIEFYGLECFTTIEGSYGRSYQNFHVVTYEDIEGKGEDQVGGKRARQFMSTEKYKEYSSGLDS